MAKFCKMIFLKYNTYIPTYTPFYQKYVTLFEKIKFPIINLTLLGKIMAIPLT